MTMGAPKKGLSLDIPKDGPNSGIPTEDPLRQTSIDGEPRTLSDPTIQSAKVEHFSLSYKVACETEKKINVYCDSLLSSIFSSKLV